LAGEPTGAAPILHPVSPHRILARAVREVVAVLRGDTTTHRQLRDRVLAVVLVTVLADVACAALALDFERHTPHSEITAYGDALFWTTTQMLTVSSQIHNPLSTAGRVLDVAMEIYAVTVVTTLGGMFAAFFHRRGHERERAAA
jgi:hypothetical protein